MSSAQAAPTAAESEVAWDFLAVVAADLVVELVEVGTVGEGAAVGVAAEV